MDAEEQPDVWEVSSMNESVQVAEPDRRDTDEDDSMENIIELGDHVVIDTTIAGQIIGTVVYRSLERISVKPDGVSHYLQHFTVSQTDEGEQFAEEDGVTNIFIVEKRSFDTFVEQQNFRVGQTVDTYDSQQQPYKTFEVVDVDQEQDAITLKDEEDITIVFNGIGLELDEPFATLRIRPMVIENKEPVQEEAEEQAEEAPGGPVAEPLQDGPPVPRVARHQGQQVVRVRDGHGRHVPPAA